MNATTAVSGIKCGSCHGRHEKIADVRFCSQTNLKSDAFATEIQRRERAEDEAAAAAKWLRDETLAEEYNRQQASLADGEAAARRIERRGEWTTEDEDALWQQPRDIPDADRAAQARWDAAWTRKPAQPRENAKERPTLDEHAGMYRNPETGEIYKVQKAVHGSGHLYAKILVMPADGGTDSGEPYFEMAKGVIYKIELAWRMTLEDAKEYGALYGVCCVCARTLTRESSIEAGIGPVCASKV